MKGAGFKLVYILVIALAAVVLLSGTNIKAILKLRSEVILNEKKLARLQEKNEIMAKELKWMKSQDDYIKFVAKKNLGMVEPGETKIYLISEDKKPVKKD